MLSAVIEYLDAVLFASIFVEGDFFPVAPKAVDLPDNDRLKLVFRCVLQHLLELLPMDCSPCLWLEYLAMSSPICSITSRKIL